MMFLCKRISQSGIIAQTHRGGGQRSGTVLGQAVGRGCSHTGGEVTEMYQGREHRKSCSPCCLVGG